MNKLSRHQMRENAFILVFEKNFSDDSVEDILESARECDAIQVDDQVEAMFRGVVQNLPMIDSVIAPNLKNWTKDRISKVSLAILRLGVYEILFSKDVGDDIVVSECVKLATTFAYEDDVSFINGVLGSIVRNKDQ